MNAQNPIASLTDSSKVPEVVKFNIKPGDENSAIVHLTMTHSNFDRSVRQYSHYISLTIQESFCFVAMKNLIRSNNYKELNYQLATDQITHDEFNRELETNPDRYHNIESKPLESANHLHHISDIVKKLDSDLSVDEVADMFSITSKSIEDATRKLGLLPIK